MLDSRGETVGPVPSDMEELAAFCRMRNNADLMGRLVYDDEGEVVFQFGKHTGKRVREVLQKDPGYFVDTARYTKRILQKVKDGETEARIAAWVSNDLTFDQRVKKT